MSFEPVSNSYCFAVDQEKYSGPFNSWLFQPLHLARKAVMAVITKFGANLENDDRGSMFWVDINDDTHRKVQEN